MSGGVAEPVAAQWHAAVPQGGQLGELRRWWAQFDDPVMLRLIETAQHVSPTLAHASARIADARAVRVARQAARLPSVEASASSTRGRSELGVPIGVASSAGLVAGWELDLFGAARAGADAALARLESRQAGWHGARVAVAAEIATTYVELRACEAQMRHVRVDAASRKQTARITSLAAAAGFRPAASADLATASAARGNVTLIQQRARCDVLVKELIALTAQDETALRRDLATGTARLPQPLELEVSTMPAAVLAQRPDIYAAERDVMAASADADEAQALRLPRVVISGSLGAARLEIGNVGASGTVLGIGPVTVTLPLFDGGTGRANAQAARARYEAASIVYAARLREAIREVEVALVTLDSTGSRSDDARAAAAGFERSYAAVDASYQAGMASLFDLEDARRSMVTSQSAVIELQRERVLAWIALYRALGGGWSRTEAYDVPLAVAPRGRP